MLNQANQIKKHTTQAFENVNNMLSASLENVEKLTNLHLESSKSAIEETTQAIKNMATISCPQELFTQASQLANNTVERNVETYRNFCEIIAATQFKIGQMFESQFNVNKTNNTSFMSNWMHKIQSTKFDTNSAINSFMNSANLAVSKAAKLANQATAMTSNNMMSASETIGNVVKTAKQAAAATVNTAKKAAAETVNTAKKATAETVVTAKKIATETVATVINSAKKASDTLAVVAKNSATTATATVAANAKKPTAKTVRTTKPAKKATTTK